MKYNIFTGCVANRYKDGAFADMTEESTIVDDLHRLIFSQNVSVPEMKIFQEIRLRVGHCRRCVDEIAIVDQSV